MNTLSVLIIKLYRLIFSIIRLKLPSYILALLYVTALHMILILGLAVLLQDTLPTAIVIGLYFSNKVYFLAGGLFAINYMVCPGFKSIITDINRASSYSLLIMYTAVDVVLVGFEYLMLR